MGGEGFISGMITSLKNNSRRKNREHFSKDNGVQVEKTQYLFPKVTEAKKTSVVNQILKKRKLSNSLNLLVVIILTCFFLIFLLFFVIQLIDPIDQ